MDVLVYDIEKLVQDKDRSVARLRLHGVASPSRNYGSTVRYYVEDGIGHASIQLEGSEPHSIDLEAGIGFTVPKGAISRITGQLIMKATYEPPYDLLSVEYL